MIPSPSLPLSPAEILAGIAFLESHAPDGFRPTIEACRRALEETRQEQTRERWRERTWDELGLCVRAESVLRDLGLRTIREVEKLMSRSDPALVGTYGRKALTKIVLRDLREGLKRKGLNY